MRYASGTFGSTRLWLLLGRGAVLTGLLYNVAKSGLHLLLRVALGLCDFVIIVRLVGFYRVLSGLWFHASNEAAGGGGPGPVL